jgi:hypothetical protein
MAAAIHLIERMGHVRTVDASTGMYESEWWAIPASTAKRLVGGRIYLHKGQDKPSFFGGVITGYRIEAEGEHSGRVIFAFTRDAAGKGVVSRGDWGNEKKYVW